MLTLEWSDWRAGGWWWIQSVYLTNSGVDAGKPQEDISSDGVMYTTDPKTGRQVRYVLNKSRKWTQDRTFGDGQ